MRHHSTVCRLNTIDFVGVGEDPRHNTGDCLGRFQDMFDNYMN